MGRLRTFTRRTFIVGSVAVAGGVAFGAYQVLRPPEGPGAPEDGLRLNPWVLIDARGVTVIVPRAEMGQGVQTTLAALVAEEMEMPLGDIRVEHGPPAEVYANMSLLIPRDYDAKRPGAVMETLYQAMPKVLGLQITGGSFSAFDAYEPMREAGAAAREVLREAGAARLGVGLDQVRAEAGTIVATDGSRIPYADLAEDAAKIEPPKSPRLKDPADWSILGKSQIRLDQPAKATGTATFAIDVRRPDMRFATVKMSPRLGGGMVSFDASEAETMPGVEKVVDLGDGFAVVATNTWLAMQAAEAVTVEWGAAPYPAETDAIFARIEEAFADKPNIVPRDEGDVMAEGPGDMIEAEYRVPYLAHATMEPMNSTALFTGDGLELWSGNQAPIMLQKAAAEAVGLDQDAVTLHTTIMGGGFGRRASIDFGVIAARVAQAMPGTPVQVTWSREEDMRHDHYRPGAIARMAARLDGGKVAMLKGDVACGSVMGSQMSIPTADRTIVEGVGDQPYRIENRRIRGYAADVAVPLGYWRSVGNSQNAFFHESFIDEMAHAAGADPVEFRLGLIRPEHARSAAVVEKVAEMAGWTGKTPEGVGRGVAFTYSFGTPVAEVIEVVDEDGSIRIAKVWIAADMGVILDPGNCEAQLTGGCVFGLTAAVHGKITFADGMVNEGNFTDYELLRMSNVPKFEVALMANADRPGGVGEVGTPPAAPALANAIFNLTGERVRHLPLIDRFDFVG